MTCKPGDLAFIPFPYADLSSAKKRPVFVLTAPDRHGDFIALAVTSVPQPDKAVVLENDTLTKGRLPQKSWIRLDKVFTLSAANIVKILGTVSERVVTESLSGLCATLGYNKTT